MIDGCSLYLAQSQLTSTFHLMIQAYQLGDLMASNLCGMVLTGVEMPQVRRQHLEPDQNLKERRPHVRTPQDSPAELCYWLLE